MPSLSTFAALNRRLILCRQCPRLRDHCRSVGRVRKAAFRDQVYHAGPVPNFGDRLARLLVVGLAPAAHGANRTGRMFTGDRSGDFLFQVMHRTGFANQPSSTGRDDGLILTDAAITAVVHCAPPANRPAPGELQACMPRLEQILHVLANLRVVITLGRVAHHQVIRHAKRLGRIEKMRAYPFDHGAIYTITGLPTVLCCYHPSQQNTFTGKLTLSMMIRVFRRARQLIELD